MPDPTFYPGLGIPDWMVRRALGLNQQQPASPVPPPVSDELQGAPGSSVLSQNDVVQGNTIPQAGGPSDAPVGPRTSVGQATGQPIPAGVAETASGEPVALTPIQTPSGLAVPNAGGGATAVGPQTSAPNPAPGQAAPQQQQQPEAQAQQPQQPPSVNDALRSAQDDIEKGIDANDPSSIAIGSYKMGALAADESSRRKGVEIAAYQDQLTRMQAQQQAQQRELMSQAHDATLQVQAAADKLRTSAPDPSVLWGSQDSWGRALVTVMAAGGLGGPSAQAVVGTVINMGMADQRARLDAAREDVMASTANQSAKYAQLKGLDDSFAANRLALAQSLQGAITNIDNSVMPAQQKAASLSALATFQEKVQDDIFKNKLEQAKANKLAGLGGGAGGGALDRTVELHPIKDINRVPEKDQDKIVKSWDNQHYWVAQNNEEAKKAGAQIAGSRALIRATTDVLDTIGDGGTGTFYQKVKAKLGAHSAGSAKLKAQLGVLVGLFVKAQGEKLNAQTQKAWKDKIDNPDDLTEQDLAEVTAASNEILDTSAAELPDGMIPPGRFPEDSGPAQPKIGDTPTGAGQRQTVEGDITKATVAAAKKAEELKKAESLLPVMRTEADAARDLPDIANHASTDDGVAAVQGAYTQANFYRRSIASALAKNDSTEAYHQHQSLNGANADIVSKTREYLASNPARAKELLKAIGRGDLASNIIGGGFVGSTMVNTMLSKLPQTQVIRMADAIYKEGR